ncbi:MULTISPECIES: hypothetical protein [unclassified Synechocystis]|uniref:hypothetical protein n=1 Tax=unclassified Synechocystis TaxID=2640012 RepID=UPI00048CBABD|nr:MULTISPECIES: hypothetical protein [unclassified Synechocystis]MCT0255291.1 hypothetical protein [Synechocystis sp. CS-94]
MMERFSPTTALWKKLSLFDRTVGAIAIILVLLIVVVLLRGNQSPLVVTQYSWRNTNIGAQTEALTMTFNHPFDPEEMESGLVIDPPLAGKTIWQGRRWFYTLTDIPRYGTNYQLTLPLASMVGGRGTQDFTSVITSRARALVYIGVSGEERGRLILYNITNPQQPQKIILTPKDLTVRQFQIYPQGDRLVFTATDPSRRQSQQNIFTVTTGINNLNTQTKVLPGKLERLWENQDYNNQRIALAANGSVLAMARENAQNPADSGLWVAPRGENPRPLGIRADKFIVGPNGNFLAVGQEGGVGLIPLNPEAGTPQFLAGMEQPLDFSPKGKELLLTQQNPDFSHSLIIYDLETRSQEEVLRSPYPLLNCRFDPRDQPRAYCLQADFVQRPGEPVQPEPYLAVINLTSGQSRPLLALPNYPEVDLTIAPDGLGLMFDQVATSSGLSSQDLLTDSQRSIVDGRVWLLPLPRDLAIETESEPDPQELTAGFAPRWMP